MINTMIHFQTWLVVSILKSVSWPCTNPLQVHISIAETKVQCNAHLSRIKSKKKAGLRLKQWSVKTNSLSQCLRSPSMVLTKTQWINRAKVVCLGHCWKTCSINKKSKSLEQSSCQVNVASNSSIRVSPYSRKTKWMKQTYQTTGKRSLETQHLSKNPNRRIISIQSVIVWAQNKAVKAELVSHPAWRWSNQPKRQYWTLRTLSMTVKCSQTSYMA